MAKKRPTGLVATCQCGVIVVAMDYERMTAKDAATSVKTAQKLRTLCGRIQDSFLDEQVVFERRHDLPWRPFFKPCKG